MYKLKEEVNERKKRNSSQLFRDTLNHKPATKKTLNRSRCGGGNTSSTNIQNAGDDDINRSGTKQHYVHNTRSELAHHPSSFQRFFSLLRAMAVKKRTAGIISH